MERKNAWKSYNEQELQELEAVCADYRRFLDEGKTERECVKTAIKLAEASGYRDMAEVIETGGKLNPGDKVYAQHMGKVIALFLIGEEPLEHGINILGAHIDSPRIDVKQVPLFEDTENVYLDTHYYGGVKKYQWLSQPMALHGVIVKKDGTIVEICVGEKEEDPVFTITDILPHLDHKLAEKKASDFVDAEKLDLLIGNRPLKQAEEETESGKKAILKILKDSYGVEEADFLSAELEIVPAGKARECGLDRSMILAYGQDDRVCAYTSLRAMLETDHVKRTACCLLVDKEEIGSTGATGMRSRFFENTMAELLECCGQYSGIKLRRTMMNSKMLSSDVSAAYDPMYADRFEKKNSAYFANGLVFNKYTGSRGKSGSNDANPEYMAELRAIMEKNEVFFQTAELGKVDEGGGGTIAYLMADYAMNVIDSGVAVLSMHAPWEVTSKADVYEALKGYKAFIKEA